MGLDHHSVAQIFLSVVVGGGDESIKYERVRYEYEHNVDMLLVLCEYLRTSQLQHSYR